MPRFMTFRPLPWLTVFAVFGIAILIYLGSWQLSRMAWKTDLLERLAAQIDTPPRDLKATGLLSAGKTCGSARFTPVSVAGGITGAPVFVYAVREGKPAHHVFRSLVQADGTAVVIDFGYVPYDRHDLIPPSNSDGPAINIIGIIRCPRKPGLFTPPANRQTALWYAADLPAMAPVLAGETSPRPNTAFYVQRTTIAGPRDTWPRTRDPRDMLGEITNNHLGYALTWFGLATALVAVYIGFHVSHGRLRLGR